MGSSVRRDTVTGPFVTAPPVLLTGRALLPWHALLPKACVAGLPAAEHRMQFASAAVHSRALWSSGRCPEAHRSQADLAQLDAALRLLQDSFVLQSFLLSTGLQGDGDHRGARRAKFPFRGLPLHMTRIRFRGLRFVLLGRLARLFLSNGGPR
ncbi:uncharacterized protein LOC125075387 [Vanessa atalanta]|uniref:uncharacterized protein LOC125075387 n=1 Tax=Vanessa atalanta TaxID=42275 RepID=UPI001FCD8020|nr:uncharacterized protein LOC125075387 [Vanessa atalanta]